MPPLPLPLVPPLLPPLLLLLPLFVDRLWIDYCGRTEVQATLGGTFSEMGSERLRQEQLQLLRSGHALPPCKQCYGLLEHIRDKL
jgi:hypothetical protein